MVTAYASCRGPEQANTRSSLRKLHAHPPEVWDIRRIPWISRPEGLFSMGFQGIGEQETVPLVNHAFACVTPAIFVVFVDFTGSAQQSLVLLVRTRICHFRRIRQNALLKARFTKGTLFETLREAPSCERPPYPNGQSPAPKLSLCAPIGIGGALKEWRRHRAKKWSSKTRIWTATFSP